VGGNRRKRIGRAFEEKLLLTLLAEPDTVVFLDQGAGAGEAEQALALLEAARERGFCAFPIDFAQAPPTEMRRGLAAVKTRIGEIAALIACSDETSATTRWPHIAAASGTPCVTVFAGSNNRRFIRRWRALGPGRCRIVHVDTLNDPAALDVDDVITRLANERLQADREQSVPPAGSGTRP
jgi:ADP-heptose:LPS heptosyltransferase